MDDQLTIIATPPLDEPVSNLLARHDTSGRRRRYTRFLLASLSSIPWVGGFLSAVAARDAEHEQREVNELHERWISEHATKLEDLAATLAEVMTRVDQISPDAHERLESPEYLSIVRRGFSIWDNAATDEKRQLVKLLLTNAAGTRLCSDDLVRLFLDWIERYHEAHFAVIRAVHNQNGITRADIWRQIRGEIPRDDSADADLFKLLIHELTTGYVIRQHREATGDGQFYKKQHRSPSTGRVMKSPFDDRDPYELTELGLEFVHYAMQDIVPRLEDSHSKRGV